MKFFLQIPFIALAAFVSMSNDNCPQVEAILAFLKREEKKVSTPIAWDDAIDKQLIEVARSTSELTERSAKLDEMMPRLEQGSFEWQMAKFELASIYLKRQEFSLLNWLSSKRSSDIEKKLKSILEELLDNQTPIFNALPAHLNSLYRKLMAVEVETGIKFKVHYSDMAREINKIARDNQKVLSPSWSDFNLSLQGN